MTEKRTRSSVRRRSAVASVATVLVALMTTLAPTAPAHAASERPLRVMTFNVEKNLTALRTLVGRMNLNVATLAMAQEVCLSHYNNVTSQYPGYTANYRVRRSGVDGCKTNADPQGQIGEAIFYSHVPQNWWTWNVHHDINFGEGQVLGHTFGAACLHIPIWEMNDVVACSTHLGVGDTAYLRPSQASQLAAWTTSWWLPSNYAVIMAGDFNMTPGNSAMDHMYGSGGGWGPFNEASELLHGRRDNEVATTKNGKYDYVFFNKARVPKNQNRVISGPTLFGGSNSSHRGVDVTVQIRSQL